MIAANDSVRARLENIWQHRDFGPFFAKHAKRPPYTLKKGGVIYNAGDEIDRLYYLDTGYAKSFSISSEGRETTTYLYGPGSVLGFRTLTSEDKSTIQNAEAITDCAILTVSNEQYFNAVNEDPALLIDLIHIFIDRLESTEKQLEMFITTDTTARVADFLLDCAIRFCPPRRQATNIPLPNKVTLPLELTHQRIAEFVGSFRETVTVALHRLEKDRVVRVEHGRVTILNVNKLKTHATNGR